MFNFSGYTHLKVIHEGSQKVVYTALRESDKMPVVLKVLRSVNPKIDEIASIYHEFEITKDLDLPGIIKTYDLIEEKNQYALSQEDMHGISVNDYIKQQPIDDLAVFFKIALQMTAIIGEIHRNEIIHKDIKPHNFIIEPKSLIIKLTDFQFAGRLLHEAQDLVAPERLEGTLAYMAPEQTGRMNTVIDYRSDFYALGVTFYKLLTNKLPFPFSDPLELIHAHLAIPPPDASEQKASVPKSLGLLIQKLMAKDPIDRYQSSIGIQADLERISKGEVEQFTLGQGEVHDQLNLSQRLYGREEETKTLLKAYNRVSQGNVEALMVCGYSGIGKTKLISEVHKRMVEDKGYFISGKFDQLQRNTPYTAITQSFNKLAKQIMAEPEERFDKIKQAMLQALGNVAQVIIDLAPDFERILGKQPPIPKLSPSLTQNRMMIFFKKFLEVVSTQDHPLILFIDDLQWIDSGSLKLLEYIMTDEALGYMLLIGAYRDNEVDDHHPLRQFLKEMEAQQKNIHSLSLGPLSATHFTSLLIDSLKCDQKFIQPLADLIYKRTEGNPFFYKQLINSLYQQKLLYFDYDQRQWGWNLEEINKLKITNNVVDLMISRLSELPAETQLLLKFAACVGNRFTIETLMAVSRHSATAIGKALWPALKKELILTLELGYKRVDAMTIENFAFILSKEITYQFVHDRVQQAVYQVIPQEEKERTHLTMARSLIEKDRDECKKNRLYEVTDHFNEAQRLITQEEKIEVANLNYEAGMQALSANAYTPMSKYLKAGLALTNDDWWEKQYKLMFKLNRGYAQSLYLIGELDQAAKLLEILLKQARKTLDKVSIYRIQCVQATTEGKLNLAVDIAIKALAILGVKIVRNPSKLNMIMKILEIKWIMRGYNFEALDKELQEISDVNIILAFEIISEIIYGIYWLLGNMFEYLGLVSTLLMLRYGAPPSASLPLTMYAMTVMNFFKDTNLAFTLWGQAERFIEQKNDKYTSSMAYSYSALFIIHLRYSFKDGRRYYQQGYQDALESGNLVAAATNLATESLYVWWEGKSCLELVDISQKALNYCRRIRMQENVDRFEFQVALARTYMTPSPSIESLLKLLEKVLQANNLYYRTISTAAMGAFFFFLERYCDAYRYHVQWYGHEEKTRYIVWIFNQKTIDALTISKLIPDAPYLKKLLYIKQFRNLSKDLKWAANECPQNYLHQYLLLEATNERLKGNYIKAIHNFNRAIENAKRGDFFIWIAIINELAGEMLFDLSMSQLAAVHIREAHYYYDRYGMIIKIKALESRYPELFASYENQSTTTKPTSTESLSSGLTSTTLDYMSVVKAGQTISKEIILERFFEKMLYVVLENAGAEKAIFLELDKKQWLVIASMNHSSFQMQNIPFKEFGELPKTIIRVALRSEEPLIIADAMTESLCKQDEYIQTIQPKSIFCLPIIQQDHMIGLIYLENNLTVGSFTRDRITVLNTLASQIAISLTNARQLEHMKELYLKTERFVPKKFLTLLEKQDILEVELGDNKKIDVTVMFADIRNFTTLSEKYGPERLTFLINAYLGYMAPIIRIQAGFVEHFLGDGILALFPIMPENAVKAALEMQQTLLTFNVDIQSKGFEPIEVGIGLNYGSAMLSILGEAERLDANVVSDAINTASRIESLNKLYKTRLLISEYLYLKLTHPEKYLIHMIDKVKLKGKTQGIRIYEVMPLPTGDALKNERLYITLFTEAFACYEKGDFNKAEIAFKLCLQKKPKDPVAGLFIDRCIEFQKFGAPPGWDGTLTLWEK